VRLQKCRRFTPDDNRLNAAVLRLEDRLALPSEAPKIKTCNDLGQGLGKTACIDMQGLPAGDPKSYRPKAPQDDEAALATIKIILQPVNRRGQWSASLPDGTVLVASSRQPFLEAARALIAAGYDAEASLEGWRPGATAFALRARLGVAARLTVDESKTRFAAWKPLPLSAVSSSIRQKRGPVPDSAQPSEVPQSASRRRAARTPGSDTQK
jgi:hypothetical protein